MRPSNGVCSNASQRHRPVQRQLAQIGDAVRELRVLKRDLHADIAQLLDAELSRYGGKVFVQPAVADSFGAGEHGAQFPQCVIEIEGE